MADPAWADRLTARLGASALVTGRPGLGWLMLEIIPAMLWMTITGAQSLEGYYLVNLLKGYGASDQALALLPLVGCGGTAIGCALVLLMHVRRPRTWCLRFGWPGRTVFLGVVLWPLAALHWGWSTTVLLGGVFASILACQILAMGSLVTWVTWIQPLIPAEQRGRFYAWRNIAGFIATAGALQLMAWSFPGTADPAAAQDWLMWVFGIATCIGILGMWPLCLVPDGPPVTQTTRTLRLGQALRHSPGIRRLLAWNAVHAIALAIAMPFLPRWLAEVGVDPGRMAGVQSWAFMPAMLVGVFCAGRWWRTVGGGRAMLGLHLLLIASDGIFLVLTTANAPWLLPPALALWGLAKGIQSVGLITRMNELFPHGDARVPAVAFGLSALCAAIVAAGLLAGYGALDGLRPAGSPSMAWLLLAGACALRVIATPLALPPRQVTDRA